MEWNRLTGFLNEEDRHTALIASQVHNGNVTKKEHLTTPKDFMPKSMDEILEEEEIAKDDAQNVESQTLSFNQHVANLKSLGKPVQTIKL